MGERRVVQVRMMWLMWAAWLAIDCLVINGWWFWESARTPAERLTETFAIAYFLGCLSLFGSERRAALVDPPA